LALLFKFTEVKFYKITLIAILCLLISQECFADWKKQDSGTLAWLHSIYFVDNDNGWIVGSNGTLLSTSDGGRTWIKRKTKTGDTFRDVYFSDAENGWILCDRGAYDKESPSYLIRTTNGGKDWRTINFSEGRDRMIRFFFTSDRVVFSIGEGGVILQMQGDGKPWKRSLLPVRYLMLDGHFINASKGFLVGGGGTMLATTDGGSNWSEPKFAESKKRTKLNSLYFADQKTGWAAGNQGLIYSTNDGGNLWREQTTGVSSDLFDIAFTDSMVGFAVGDNGIVLRTTTAGAKWTVERTSTRHKLERVLIHGTRGFAIGYGGTILTTEISGSVQ
jgi:photosystem II stability/assembly factor-like uncharacterized protein